MALSARSTSTWWTALWDSAPDSLVVWLIVARNGSCRVHRAAGDVDGSTSTVALPEASVTSAPANVAVTALIHCRDGRS